MRMLHQSERKRRGNLGIHPVLMTHWSQGQETVLQGFLCIISGPIKTLESQGSGRGPWIQEERIPMTQSENPEKPITVSQGVCFKFQTWVLASVCPLHHRQSVKSHTLLKYSNVPLPRHKGLTVRRNWSCQYHRCSQCKNTGIMVKIMTVWFLQDHLNSLNTIT